MLLTTDHGVLSKRGQVNHDNLGPMLDFFTDLIHNTYDPKTNPSGIINAGIAEDSLNYDSLSRYYADLPLTFDDYTYGNNLGCSQELAHLYTSFINCSLAPTEQVKESHLIVGAGVSAVIDAIIYAVCDPGDGVLITAPYYNGFDTDLTLRSSAVPVAVNCPETSEPEILGQALEDEFLRQRAKGVTCKAVILCNPHNPLGRCASRDLILTYVKFCKKWQLWLISDEIYAFSVFASPRITAQSSRDSENEHDTGAADSSIEKLQQTENPLHTRRDDMPDPAFQDFTSILHLTVTERDGFDRVLMLHGMSKDFCANGFRIGCCIVPYSQDLRIALTANAILGKISGPSDAAFRKILGDTAFCSSFLHGNRKALAHAYAYFTAWCNERNIPHRKCQAGHFIVLDLQKWLPEDSFDGEAALAKKFVKHGINISAGLQYHFARPGYFRFTFSMRRDYLDVALDRFERALRLDK